MVLEELEFGACAVEEMAVLCLKAQDFGSAWERESRAWRMRVQARFWRQRAAAILSIWARSAGVAGLKWVVRAWTSSLNWCWDSPGTTTGELADRLFGQQQGMAAAAAEALCCDM